ncbi:GTPase ObgE [Aureliella helgolandensis]|uniref:GTPase Obg n=1 Tax=Aureliella helgolandensis TaxID=2527968 RepID=A0A518G1V3_9BACT|nr:GTPase ObgE [Aureliella helgolandensis]QDV22588.1 GTPase Obg [Aureliella helgolandensis]
MFVDRAEVEIEAGKGGDGCVAFRREKHVPHGGPSGGDGGNGGSVIVRAREGVNSLMEFAHRKHWRAPRGERGEGSDRHGKSGSNLIIEVPPGTVLIDSESGMIIKDLVADQDEVIVARGGRGGKGNPHFKHSTNQAPRESTPGTMGEMRRVIFELKVIADVGLIGKPNAGKSTLLSRLSRARPEIADYPFTTKFPNLGQVIVDIDASFVMADIPGLIEGASSGVGLGHDFLRHITRAGILVHLVEPLPTDGTDPLENYRVIRHELMEYSDELAARPEIVVVSKAEIPESEEVFEQLKAEVNSEVLRISAVTGQGLNVLIRRIANELAARDREAVRQAH